MYNIDIDERGVYMGKIISIFNQKGGVGKTTTVVNLATYLADAGKTILLIDIDPQGNSTSGLGYNKNELNKTVYETILGDLSIDECIHPTEQDNLDILPSNNTLAGAEVELSSMAEKEFLLKQSMTTIIEKYDYVLIDCPPSLSLLTINTLTASDSVIIPIQCEYYALEGVSDLMNTFNLVKEHINPDIDIEGILITMYDGRTNLSEQVEEEVRRYFKTKVFETIIPRNISLAEAPSYGKSILEYNPRSRGAKAYQALAKEFLAR